VECGAVGSRNARSHPRNPPYSEHVLGDPFENLQLRIWNSYVAVVR
jgi:hypothetical protein